jgi:UDP-glucose 4-epimerase
MTRATCVRDFVHVLDLADAHTRAIEHLLDHGASHAVNRRYRSGNYREGLEALEHVIGRGFNVKYGPRRTGDSPVLVADNALAKQTIGWSPRHDLKSMIDTAWNWHSNYLPV